MAGFEKMDYKESKKVIGNFAIEPLPELFAKKDRRKSKNGVILSFALSNSY